jgi:hypothetical protein
MVSTAKVRPSGDHARWEAIHAVAQDSLRSVGPTHVEDVPSASIAETPPPAPTKTNSAELGRDRPPACTVDEAADATAVPAWGPFLCVSKSAITPVITARVSATTPDKATTVARRRSVDLEAG